MSTSLAEVGKDLYAQADRLAQLLKFGIPPAHTFARHEVGAIVQELRLIADALDSTHEGGTE